MPTLVILTTKEDLSLPLFFSSTLKANWIISAIFYEDLLPQGACPSLNSDFIYLRDPFNSQLSPGEVFPVLESSFQNNKKSVFIDHLSTTDEVYLEDKWLQYLVFSDFMPHTWQLSTADSESGGSHIYKKRISSRARGISFVPPKNEQEKYIGQDRLKIAEEYRVLEVHHNILNEVLVKSSKTEIQEVKVQRALAIPSNLRDFILRVQKKHHFDLVGYDVAKTEDGNLHLIEVNRSPQIRAYVRETGVNPFQLLLSHLQKTSS